MTDGPITDPIPLPDPPLEDREGGIVLRPWGGHADDARALSEAWADPTIAAGTRPPADRSVAGARRWISGEADRRRRGLALDLVIARAGAVDEVLGEVGVTNLDDSGRAEIGFWVSPAGRGQGVATVAVRLLTTWSLAPDGLGRRLLWARVRLGNDRAASVLRRAGYSHRGDSAEQAVWVRSG